MKGINYIFISILLFAFMCRAEIYRCVEDNGQVTFTDQPCLPDEIDGVDHYAFDLIKKYSDDVDRQGKIENISTIKDLLIKNFNETMGDDLIFIKVIFADGNFKINKEMFNETSINYDIFMSRFNNVKNDSDIVGLKGYYYNEAIKRVIQEPIKLSCNQLDNEESVVNSILTQRVMAKVDIAHQKFLSNMFDPIFLISYLYVIEYDLKQSDKVFSKRSGNLASQKEATIIVNNGNECPEPKTWLYSEYRDSDASSPKNNTFKKTCKDDFFDESAEIRFYNPNPFGTLCHQLVDKVRKIENDPMFNCDQSIINAWKKALHVAEANGCAH
ncbi:DUF4124 domain-containing protein [Shewanella algae]|uniref:DUF4124 domain-containing protein n=1 Tax=Shewanella algae TaxID=38313 RepID=UPI003B684F26